MALKIGWEVSMVSHKRHFEILRIEYHHGPWGINMIIHFDWHSESLHCCLLHLPRYRGIMMCWNSISFCCFKIGACKRQVPVPLLCFSRFVSIIFEWFVSYLAGKGFEYLLWKYGWRNEPAPLIFPLPGWMLGIDDGISIMYILRRCGMQGCVNLPWDKNISQLLFWTRNSGCIGRELIWTMRRDEHWKYD